MFRVEMLPAARGDCLWIEYGDPAAPRRVLIDGGIGATAGVLRARIERLPVSARRFELLVVTHIDLDHIAGILQLLESPPRGLSFGDVWFNGWRHLSQGQTVLSARQGEALTQLLLDLELPWNREFGGKAVMVPPDGRLPEKTLPGGMTLTLLSPTPERLRRLKRAWKKEVEAEKRPDQPGHPEQVPGRLSVLGGPRPDLDALAKSPFTPDDSAANGSSIAFVAAYGGRRCVFAGDAFADDLRLAVGRLAREEGAARLEVDALKLAHHGGRKNTSAGLLSALVCGNYLFSTNGSVYGHPDHESVGRVVVHGRDGGPPRLFFNYRSDQNRVWADARLSRTRYEPVFPDEGRDGVTVEL